MDPRQGPGPDPEVSAEVSGTTASSASEGPGPNPASPTADTVAHDNHDRPTTQVTVHA